jgi:hypothetical protein
MVRLEFRNRVLAVLWVLLWLLLPRFWLWATPVVARFSSVSRGRLRRRTFFYRRAGRSNFTKNFSCGFSAF